MQLVGCVCVGLYFTSPFLYFLAYIGAQHKSIKCKYLETVRCDFRENFHVCLPRRDMPFGTNPDPLTQLGEGLGGPKVGG